MSICPKCGKPVKKSSGDKKKIKSVWVHRSRCKRAKGGMNGSNITTKTAIA